jgi:hypothetical protein
MPVRQMSLSQMSDGQMSFGQTVFDKKAWHGFECEMGIGE